MAMPVMPDNSGYFDPADIHEAFDPFESDEHIQWVIQTNQFPIESQ